MQTIDKPADALADALREWFALDTWTLREGLLLLAGIDPHRADCFKLAGDGGWQPVTHPAYSRIGQPPAAEWRDDGPVVRGVGFSPDDVLLLHELSRHWHAKPEHAGMTRATPAHFVEWAQSKGFAPPWLAVAQAAGIVPTQPAASAAQPSATAAPAEWMTKAQAEARHIIQRQAARNLFPSQQDIADEVAAALRNRGIFGADGKPLTGATVKRHALKGISSAGKKAQSTVPSRGK